LSAADYNSSSATATTVAFSDHEVPRAVGAHPLASIYKTAGFNDDTRAFCSIPARHDLARRMDANYLGGLVARHVIDESDARKMARELAYDLVKKRYRLS
jgi:glucuronate isomerase